MIDKATPTSLMISVIVLGLTLLNLLAKNKAQDIIDIKIWGKTELDYRFSPVSLHQPTGSSNTASVVVFKSHLPSFFILRVSYLLTSVSLEW